MSEIKRPGDYGDAGDEFGRMDRDTTPEEERLRSLLRAERFLDVLDRNSAEETRIYGRGLMVSQEELWETYENRPNIYIIENTIVPGLVHKSEWMLWAAPLYDSYSKPERAAGLDTDEEKRERLGHECRRLATEINARTSLVAKLAEQDVFAGDAEKYTVDAFIRLGKLQMEAKNYGIILNSPETRERLGHFGEKVEKAFWGFVEIAQGKARGFYIVSYNHERARYERMETYIDKKLPNLFAIPPVRGLMETAIEGYIIPRSIGERPVEELVGEDERDKTRYIRHLEHSDNRSAAFLGLLLFRHWDLDAFYSVGREGFEDIPDISRLTADDIANLALELSWTDGAKLMHPEIRRALEYGRFGKGERGELTYIRREHPRPAGTPITLGCYPILSTHALNIMTTEIVAQNRDNPSEKKKIPISVWGLVTGDSVTRREKGRHVTWMYERKRLSEVKWDEIEILEHRLGELPPEERRKEVAQIAFGIMTNAYEVPYKFQGFLSYKNMFAEFTRTDYLQQYQEIVTSDKLLKLNKPIENALKFMATGYNISPETLEKLTDYVKMAFLAGLAASIVTHSQRGGTKVGEELERAPQIMYSGTTDKEGLKRNLIEASAISRFLNFERKGLARDLQLAPTEDRFYEFVVNNRRAPNPFELEKEGIRGWFTREELAEIAPLYPLASSVSFSK